MKVRSVMLLIKGKSGKSVIMNILSKNTKNITIIYDNCSVFLDGLILNSDNYSFKEFIFELSNYIKGLEENQIDYLIIYTNQEEQIIKYQEELFQKWEYIYGFSIIVGCK
jgi:hypothetical protein